MCKEKLHSWKISREEKMKNNVYTHRNCINQFSSTLTLNKKENKRKKKSDTKYKNRQ